MFGKPKTSAIREFFKVSISQLTTEKSRHTFRGTHGNLLNQLLFSLYLFSLGFLAILGSVQGLFFGLHSVITPGDTQGFIWGARDLTHASRMQGKDPACNTVSLASHLK